MNVIGIKLRVLFFMLASASALHSARASTVFQVEHIPDASEFEGQQCFHLDQIPVQRVIVEEVSGFVRYRQTNDGTWSGLSQGELDLKDQKVFTKGGPEFQFGYNGWATLYIYSPSYGIYRLRFGRLGTFSLKSLGILAISGREDFFPDMLKKYGRTRYHIEAAGLDHELTICSPSNVMAVRG